MLWLLAILLQPVGARQGRGQEPCRRVRVHMHEVCRLPQRAPLHQHTPYGKIRLLACVRVQVHTEQSARSSKRQQTTAAAAIARLCSGRTWLPRRPHCVQWMTLKAQRCLVSQELKPVGQLRLVLHEVESQGGRQAHAAAGRSRDGAQR